MVSFGGDRLFLSPSVLTPMSLLEISKSLIGMKKYLDIVEVPSGSTDQPHARTYSAFCNDILFACCTC